MTEMHLVFAATNGKWVNLSTEPIQISLDLDATGQYKVQYADSACIKIKIKTNSDWFTLPFFQFIAAKSEVIIIVTSYSLTKGSK